MNAQNNTSPVTLEEQNKAAVLSSQKVIPYFYVPFALLLIAPFFRIYWLYVNWQAIKKAKSLDISSFWRAIGMIFFVGELFEHIVTAAQEQGYQGNTNYKNLSSRYVFSFILYVFFCGCAFLSGVYNRDLLVVIFVFLTLIFLIRKVICLYAVNKAMRFYVDTTKQQQLSRLATDPTQPVYGFLEVSRLYFILLNLLTCRLYIFYWFYKNWQAIQRAEKDNTTPFWRSSFYLFFVHSLFKKIDHTAQSRGFQPKMRYNHLATIYLLAIIIITLLSREIDFPGGKFGINYQFILVPSVSMVIKCFCDAFCIAPMRKAIHFYREKAIRKEYPC
eukprot:gene268-351_t